MKRGNIDLRRREKRSAVLGMLLFILLQGACAVGFWALSLIPELPRWLVLLFLALAGILPGAAGARPVGAAPEISGD